MPQVWIPTRRLRLRPHLPLRYREHTLVLQATAQRVTAVEATSRLAISALATELREATAGPLAATVASSSVATAVFSSAAATVESSSAAMAVSSSAATVDKLALASSAATVDKLALATSNVATRAVTRVATTEQAFIGIEILQERWHPACRPSPARRQTTKSAQFVH